MLKMANSLNIIALSIQMGGGITTPSKARQFSLNR